MVTGNTDTIKLELIVDRAELERQLSSTFSASLGVGAGGVGVPEGVGKDKKKPTKVDLGQQATKQLGNLAKLTGISLGITALVKTSKVASTTLGAMQTVIGALVDSFLAPLVPLMIPLITKAAEFIGPAAEAGKKTADFLGEIKQDLGTTLPYMLGAGKPTDYPEDVSRMGLWREIGENLWSNFKQNSPLMNPNWTEQLGLQREKLTPSRELNNGGLAAGLEININVNASNDEDDIINKVIDKLRGVLPSRDSRSRGFGGG